MAHEKSTQCVYPDCPNTRRTRGLCHGHYQTMRSRVRAADKDGTGGDTLTHGEKLEADLQRRGLLLPKGTGGAPATDSARAFRIGSDIVAKPAPDESATIERARAQYVNEGTLEIDDAPAVSRADTDGVCSEGAYVAAWVWVADMDDAALDAEEARMIAADRIEHPEKYA
jgi:hypothetical protein